MQKTERQRVFGLDLMRATAITLVVFSHVSWLLPEKTGLLFDLLSVFGVIGVEIFFVLSGFLIGRIIYQFFLKEDFKFGDITYFWIRRWFRTLPNYFLALQFNMIVILAIGSSLPDGIWKYFFFIQNFSSGITPFYYESWTLSVEEIGYLLGPLLIFLLFIIRPKSNRSKQYLFMVLFIIILCTLLRYIYNLNDDIREMRNWNLNLKSVVIYRLDAIYYGALAAYLYFKFPKFWNRFSLGLFFLGISVFGLVNILPLQYNILIETNPGFWNIWYLPICSLSIALCLPLMTQWKINKTIPGLLITKLSLISYAVYILHYSIILQVLRHQIPNEDFVGFDLIIFILLYLATVLFCSYLLFKFFESPFTELRDHPRIKSWLGVKYE